MCASVHMRAGRQRVCGCISPSRLGLIGRCVCRMCVCCMCVFTTIASRHAFWADSRWVSPIGCVGGKPGGATRVK